LRYYIGVVLRYLEVLIQQVYIFGHVRFAVVVPAFVGLERGDVFCQICVKQRRVAAAKFEHRDIFVEPFFQSGKFLFAKHLKKLETQCREFPYGKKRDSLDVLAYVPKNLGFAKPKKVVQVHDPNSFEAIIEQIRGKDKGDYPFDKARRYSQNATPAMF